MVSGKYWPSPSCSCSRGNTLNINPAPVQGHLYNLHFPGVQLNLSVNQQGLVKSIRRGRGKRTWEHRWKHAMKTIKLTRCREKDSQVESFSFYWPPNMFKIGRLKSPINFLKWQTLGKAFPFFHFTRENEKLGSLSCLLLGGGGGDARSLT